MSPETPERRVPGGVPPLRVLCVDDNHDMADSAAELLRTVGFDARACYCGFTALAEAAAFLPGVCLIDLNMPGMDGDELAVQLRAQAGGRPLVLVAVTAMSNTESSQRISDAGFDLHLVKPVDPHQLLAIVDALWRAWESVGEITHRGRPDALRKSEHPG
jgi:DNA-binding response OmpR family regulator